MAGVSAINYGNASTEAAVNADLNTTFTLALQGILTTQNNRSTLIKTNIGLPVQNNYVTNKLSLPSGASVTLTAGQFVLIISDLPLLVAVTSDTTVANPTPATGTMYGNVFTLSGSYLTTGVTLTNPANIVTPNVATISVALIT